MTSLTPFNQQIETPQISFAHYLDLLKRKTWQVLSVSLLGLAIGGLVAMLIPRYYVARTTVQFNRPILDPKLGSPEDPMAQVVEAARVTVPHAVELALDELRWPEYLSDDEEARREFVESVRKEIVVFDLGPHNRARNIAKLQIVYSDTSGYRAKEMANTLRDVWLREFVDNLSRDAMRDLQSVQEEIAKTQQDRNILSTEVQSFERLHELNPDDYGAERTGQLSRFTEERHRVAARLREVQSQLGALDARIVFLTGMLEGMEPTIPVSGADRFEDPAMKARWVQLNQQLPVIAAAFQNYKPAHPIYKAMEARLNSVREQIAQLEQSAGDQRADKPNPQYVLLQGQLNEARANQKAAVIERDRLQELVTAQDQKLARMPEIIAEYQELLAKRDKIDQDLLSLQAERRAKEKISRRINTEHPVAILHPAYQPPTPTVPNRTLVTLAGCLIGLGVAIVLILLIDFFQATYKTVNDVERGLGLQVLGSLAHMETEVERQQVASRRVRLTVVSGVFLTLLVCVVTIYYVSPTSLPDAVQRLLQMLLGPAG